MGLTKKRKNGRSVALVTLLGVSLMAGAAMAAEPRWPSGAYPYVVVDQDLKEVLSELGRNTKIPIRISETISGKRVRGLMKTGDAEQFFKGLCASYGLIWYYDGSVLYVNSENELRSESFNTERFVDAAQMEKKLNERLESQGAADQRYPIKFLSGNQISVSGPPAYVSMVKQALDGMPRAKTPRVGGTETSGGDDSRVRVFRGGS